LNQGLSKIAEIGEGCGQYTLHLKSGQN